MENVVFISSHLDGLDYHGQEELRSKLRLDLTKLGLEFYPTVINGKKHFMAVTNKLEPMKALAKTYNQSTIYISDNRRATFVVSLVDNSPTKLGTLKRSLSQTPSESEASKGTFCLIVTQDNKDYYYIVE